MCRAAVQALQGDDLLAVRHALSAEHGLLPAGAFPEIRVGDMLARGLQRCAALRQGVHQGERCVTGQVQEKAGMKPWFSQDIANVISVDVK